MPGSGLKVWLVVVGCGGGGGVRTKFSVQLLSQAEQKFIVTENDFAHHHHTTTHHKLNGSNILVVTHLILTKFYGQFSGTIFNMEHLSLWHFST